MIKLINRHAVFLEYGGGSNFNDESVKPKYWATDLDYEKNRGYFVLMKESLMDSDQIRLIEKLDSLPIKRRVEIFRELSPRGREELVQFTTQPGKLIRKISEEEMYFTVKSLGEEEALDLLAFTTGRQLTYILDLELWKKDMFNPKSAEKWLKIIARLGEEKILQFIQVSDPELILTAFNSFIKVHMRDPDIDLVEQLDFLPPFTMENVFFVEFLSYEAEDALKEVLETIYSWNNAFYFNLLEELAMGMHSEHEESAARWSRARLADHGFPEFDEALEIYQYLKRSAVSDPMDERDERFREDSGILAYPLKVIETDNLFKRCLESVTDTSEKDRLSMELAHLANKVIVADGRDPGSVDDLKRSLHKVGGYINIALEDMCGEDVKDASGFLQSNHMETLFRRGFSLILDLRKEAQKFVRSYEGGIDNLGYPLAGLIKGLFQKRPIFAGSVLDGHKGREFEHLSDLSDIRALLDHSVVERQWEPF